MEWEVLLERPSFVLRRCGRFLVADLVGPHLVLSTSVRNGGQVDNVRHLLNHQSCEAAAHTERQREITERGLEAYHDTVCAEVGLLPGSTAMMGTAANMNYAVVATRADRSVAVTAVVTAGVEGNATCAGDPAAWRETEAGMEKVPAYAGTINTMLLINTPVTAAGALARRRDDDGREERRVAATGGAEPVVGRSGHRHRDRSVLVWRRRSTAGRR